VHFPRLVSPASADAASCPAILHAMDNVPGKRGNPAEFRSFQQVTGDRRAVYAECSGCTDESVDQSAVK
jgi:hypothetical protein